MGVLPGPHIGLNFGALLPPNLRCRFVGSEPDIHGVPQQPVRAPGPRQAAMTMYSDAFVFDLEGNKVEAAGRDPVCA
jgi:hypothetical protein